MGYSLQQLLNGLPELDAPARFNMIEQQIRPWNVSDPEVLRLLSLVKREDFVPLAYRALAFVDQETPLGQGQCMLPPCIEARMLQDAAVHKHEKGPAPRRQDDPRRPTENTRGLESWREISRSETTRMNSRCNSHKKCCRSPTR